MQEIKKYRIYAGMGGGFNNVGYIRTVTDTISEANREAYREAVESYYSYEGSGGLFDREEELENNPDLTEDELQEMENNDIESWIDYWVEEEIEGKDYEDEE